MKPQSEPFNSTPLYEQLVQARSSFRCTSSRVVDGGGVGFCVDRGEAFRLTCIGGAQAVDLDIFSADDPAEHFAAGAQFYREGGYLAPGKRIWATPPESRALAIVVGDTCPPYRHKVWGAHCNPHHWVLFGGRHPRTCYDNLRAGCAMVGLNQRYIHDNLNLFMNSHIDPISGAQVTRTSDVRPDQYVEFYAEVPLLVAFSVCPYGDCAVPPDRWRASEIPVQPIQVDIFATGVPPATSEERKLRQ